MFTILLTAYAVNGQDSIPAIKQVIKIGEPVDCLPYKKGIACLTKQGDIYQVNLPDFSFSKISWHSYAAIAVDRQQTLWAVDSFSSYYSLQDTGWHFEGRANVKKVHKLLFSRQNIPILITSLGILNSKTGMFYGENKYRKRSFSTFSMREYQTDCAYIDDQDNLWMGANSRISKEVHVFSIKKNKFITSELKGFSGFHSVQDIFGDGKQIFFVDLDFIAGMSSIKTYQKDTIIRIHHPEYDTMTIGPLRHEAEYIGAGFYDATSKEIYYLSNLGLLKSKYNPKKAKIVKQEKFFPIQGDWNGYEYENAAFPLYLKRMFRHENMIIYFHSGEGIFVFDGLTIINIL